jgi:hypothetical protein
VRLAAIRSVEVTPHNDLDDLELGLAQISCVYNLEAMAETLHELYEPNNDRSISATTTDVPGHRTFISKERHSAVTPEQLSERWSIGLAQSK